MIALGILLIAVCAILGFFVLIQNPKGGGLSGSFGGLGQQMMGVQQSTDTVEKGTWILATLMALLCIATVAFKPSNGSDDKAIRSIDAIKGAKIATPAVTAPAPTQAATAPTTAEQPAATAAPATQQTATATQATPAATPAK
jgi:preprotein translocase subunit SecG